ncbi:hypothetical protein V8F33_002413 [Rhypophila sp. PSN 637]
MDESLSSALRNYIISHSGVIFENDYQTGVVRPNLALLAFGPKAVNRDETLFSDLRNMSLTRDEGAPISVLEEQIVKFRERNDIAQFRGMIQASTDKKRQAYFKEADRLRLQGLEPEPTPGARGAGIAAPVAVLLSSPRLQNDGELSAVDAGVSKRYIDAQLLHLSSIAPSIPRAVPETAAASKSQHKSCCFICSRDFANHSCLTRHFRDAHLVDGTFDKPLPCRECKRAGGGGAEVVVHGPAQWCNHLEHIHGLIHTPSVNAGVNPRHSMPASRLICLLCEAPMASTSALLAHMDRTEIPRYRKVGYGIRTADGFNRRWHYRVSLHTYWVTLGQEEMVPLHGNYSCIASSTTVRYYIYWIKYG